MNTDTIARDDTATLIGRWRQDSGATYKTWFLWEERLKNFRSIRRGLAEVVAEIQADTFGTAYKGSSLETVVGSIAEQRQIFRGADHAWLWKPKLRIPDIYENRENQLAFASFLHTCSCCDTERQVLEAIHTLERHKIKGLGPTAANLLYFLHPTITPPFNTAIVNGYNALTGARVKLGKWPEYLAMRQGIVELNARYRHLLSNDLGAIAGLLFDIGSKRYQPPPRPDDLEALRSWEADLANVRKDAANSDPALAADRTHTEVQGWLRDLGAALGFDVWVAHQVAAAFEVEHTTSIYSGIVRLLDLALGPAEESAQGLFLVAPDGRENDVRAQLARPAFKRVRDLQVRFLAYGELERNRDAIAKFGQGMRPIEKLAKILS